jgi:hypothetical protein
VLLAAVIAIEGIEQHGGRMWPVDWHRAGLTAWARQQLTSVRASWRSILAASFVPLGLVAYMAYLTNTFGDPLAFIHVQATFGRDVSGAGAAGLIGRTIERLNVGPHLLAGQLNARTLLDVIFTLVFAALVIAVAFRMRSSYAVFTVLTFVVPLLSGSVGSMTRYVLMLLPCFMMLAAWGHRNWVDRIVVGVSLPLLAYFTVLFSHWYFAG